MGHVAHLRGNSHNSNQFSFIMSNLKKIFVIKDSITFKRCSNYRHLFVCLTLWEEDFQRLYFFFSYVKIDTHLIVTLLYHPPPPSKDNGVIKRTFTQLKLLPHKFQFCKMVLEKKIIFVFLNNYNVIYLYRTAPLV